MSENSIKTGTAAMISGQLSGVSGKSLTSGFPAIIARVTFVLLDDSDKDKFNFYGGWKSLGLIECQPYMSGTNTTFTIVAKPMEGHFRKYPLVNELVRIEKGVSYRSQGGQLNYDADYYYTDIIPTWNSIEHNATPDSLLLESSQKNNTSYSDAISGNSSKTNVNNDVSVTGIFKETGNINKLISYPGDMVIQGRSGHAIRLSSTIDNFNSPIVGKDRSPFLLISNNHKKTNTNTPTFEDVNNDGSSFYMLNGHNSGFQVSSLNFESFHEEVNNNVKSNYVVPTTPSNNDVTQAASVVDNNTNIVDKQPTSSKVLNNIPSKNTSNSTDDLEELPPNESNLLFAVETQDTIHILECDKSYSPDIIVPPTDVISDKTTYSIFYRVPYETQPKDSTWCFIASTSMLLKYLGVNTNQNEINSIANKQGNLNTYELTKHYGLPDPIKIPIPGSNLGIQAIKDNLIKYKKPFILERKGRNSSTHFVVVVGIDTSGSIISWDPGSYKYKGYKLKPEDLKTSGGTIRIFSSKK